MVLKLMPFKIDAFGDTNVGLVRQNNEDYWAGLPDQLFFVLADGMGGHQAGEVASREAVTGLCKEFSKILSDGGTTKPLSALKKELASAISAINAHIYQLSCEKHSLRGMGTTLCCTYFRDRTMLYAHVGDSRIYRFRKGVLEQLTRDDSLFRELVELGELTEEDSEQFLYKNIITKAIGLASYVEPSVKDTAVEEGDLIMLCSDGLTDMLTKTDIEAFLKRCLLERKMNIEETTKALIAAANERGGVDNTTVVLIQVQQESKK
jgi:serine/threonine protein phosphatase PrpC